MMVKIGDVKSTKTMELSRKLQETRMESLVSIEPRLTQAGELTLWVSGRFWDTYDVRNKVTEYGDEWMAIGLFPGYDAHVNGYWHKDGEKERPVVFIGASIMVNGILCGFYTIFSLLEFLDPKPAEFHNGITAASVGLVGTYKYRGAEYEMNTYEKNFVDVKRDNVSRLLLDFCIEVDGVKIYDMRDRKGVFLLKGEFKHGDSLSFKIVTFPQDPQMDKNLFAPFINREFKAICK